MTKLYLGLIFFASILSIHVYASKRTKRIIAFSTAESWGIYSWKAH